MVVAFQLNTDLFTLEIASGGLMRGTVGWSLLLARPCSFPSSCPRYSILWGVISKLQYMSEGIPGLFLYLSGAKGIPVLLNRNFAGKVTRILESHAVILLL